MYKKITETTYLGCIDGVDVESKVDWVSWALPSVHWTGKDSVILLTEVAGRKTLM